MTFLLNFVHFDAIFADSETDFANFETKIPDRLVEDLLFTGPYTT